jgi:hypothetical protein
MSTPTPTGPGRFTRKNKKVPTSAGLFTFAEKGGSFAQKDAAAAL